jgi:hypothetical protein
MHIFPPFVYNKKIFDDWNQRLGRIGRLVLRASFENPRGVDITTVNDPS